MPSTPVRRSLVHPMMKALLPASVLLAIFSACATNTAQPRTGGSDGGGNDAGGSDGGAGAMDATSMPAESTDAGEDGAGVDAPPPPPDPVVPLSVGTIKLEVWGPRTIRVLYALTTPTPGPSLAVNQSRPVTPFTVNTSGPTLTVSTGELQAQID